MKVAALIIGIDGWVGYTLPLVKSIQKYQPDCAIVVIDNASKTPYPDLDIVYRTSRICYSAAINYAYSKVEADYYIVLSNDVLCTGKFDHLLKPYGVLGIELIQAKEPKNLAWLMGWCLVFPKEIWEDIGGWDENYKISSWEDVDISTTILKSKWDLVFNPTFPFKHLDQKQRFTLVNDYWQSEVHNMEYFFRKHFDEPKN